MEIRLPIKNKDLSKIKLPEEYRNAFEESTRQGQKLSDHSDVSITSDLMGEQKWQGKIVRTESAIDEMSQQLYVVAQIIRPYDGEFNKGAQIKMGQYVTALITGRKIDNALVIPSSAIYQGSYVYTVEEGLLMRKSITIDWQNGEESIVSSGLKQGDQLVLTSLGQVNSGTPVAIKGDREAIPSNKKVTNKPKTNTNEKKVNN